MKASELRELDVDELESMLDEAKEEHFNLRFQQTSGQLQDFNRLRIVRREVARLYTVIHEQKLEAVQNDE